MTCLDLYPTVNNTANQIEWPIAIESSDCSVFSSFIGEDDQVYRVSKRLLSSVVYTMDATYHPRHTRRSQKSQWGNLYQALLPRRRRYIPFRRVSLEHTG
jgi:hypothetical protein